MTKLQEPEERIRRAVAVLRKLANSDDRQVYSALIESDIQPEMAEKLVMFLPIAYGRVLLKKMGIRFSNQFKRALNDGTLVEHAFADEPIWSAVVECPREEVSGGISGEHLICVAARSAEFDAANQLLNGGSGPENIVLTPPVILWPVESSKPSY
jgi:hypothetical protein